MSFSEWGHRTIIVLNHRSCALCGNRSARFLLIKEPLMVFLKWLQSNEPPRQIKVWSFLKASLRPHNSSDSYYPPHMSRVTFPAERSEMNMLNDDETEERGWRNRRRDSEIPEEEVTFLTYSHYLQHSEESFLCLKSVLMWHFNHE